MLEQLKKAKDRLSRRDQLLQRLGESAPSVAEALRDGHPSPVWDERLSNFVEAWNWARADSWLRRLADPGEQQRLSDNLYGQCKRVQSSVASLAAAKAWCFCLSRLTEREAGHLRAWQLAIQKLGGGTSKFASRYRREARLNLEGCRTAIPAWVMPLYRVAETIDPRAEAFNVAIIDEASQSGFEALLLHYLAKRVIVVGDEKQISPSWVGVNREDVVRLRERHIMDLPFSDAFDIENSFFGLAQVRMGSPITLREHFRCMPEIIQFSNDLCYSQTPLIPLKQYGTDRLTPTIVVVHVADGYQRGTASRATNRPEAEAIVARIAACCRDVSYKGKSIGVISLLGDAQANLVRGLLLDQLGPEVLERRQLVCGDAYAFQGDERDIIFLSLVSAPGEHRIGALSENNRRHVQRFNVAASRAKEQMLVFHSATVNDLSATCLRRRLLQYCQDPRAHNVPGAENLDVAELRRAARERHRERGNQPLPFESWFEVDVFLAIEARGYLVIPQFEMGGYRVDLVVLGGRSRLAVECDGDIWHGPDRYEEDSGRQRQLERSGLVFWRILGSVFYRDPEAALQSAWRTLEHLDIRPQSAGAAVPAAPTEEVVTLPHAPGIGLEGEDLTGEPEEATARVSQLELEEDVEEADQVTAHNPAPLLAELGQPYKQWAPHPLPDPGFASQKEVMQALVEIVKAEGPMLCVRAYRKYALGAGIRRIGKQIRSSLNRAMAQAVRAKTLDERNEYQTRDQVHRVVFAAGDSPVLLREQGGRSLEEIPPSELALLMRRLEESTGDQDRDAMFRKVLACYGLKRLTQNVQSVLERAWEMRQNAS